MPKRPEPGGRPACPLGACDGSGWLLGPEDVARPCECRDRIVARARLRGVTSVVPRKFASLSFEHTEIVNLDRDTVEVVREYCRNIEKHLDDGKGLWLLGDVGTGKTALAMLVSINALEAGRSVAIYSMPKLLAQIRHTYDAGPSDQSYTDLFDRLASVDLLHIDDLGAEKRTDWVIEQVYALVNERYEARRAIVVTSNAEDGSGDVGTAVEKLSAEITSRTVSRLVEICGDPIPMFGDDRRYSAPDRAAVARLAPAPDPTDAPGIGVTSPTLGPLDH